MASTLQLIGRFLAVAATAAVAACSSATGEGDFSPGAILSGGRDLAAEQQSAQAFAPIAICPTIQVRDGTQLIRIYERGRQDDLSAIRFQGTIQKFARECRTDSTGATTIKVGVAGRVLAGPSAATGDVTLPVRIVLVKDGSEVIYSQLHTVTANVTTTTPSVAWQQVVDGLIVPPNPTGQYLIYVGFDETAPRRS